MGEIDHAYLAFPLVILPKPHGLKSCICFPTSTPWETIGKSHTHGNSSHPQRSSAYSMVCKVFSPPCREGDLAATPNPLLS